MASSTSATFFLIASSLFLTAVLASGQVPQFNYSHPQGWGRSNPQYAVCSTGRRQSPININTNDVIVNQGMQPLTRHEHIYNATLATDGIEVKVVFNDQGALIIDGKSYDLKQMHWHTPSEHRLNGVQYGAELHQVYAADDGSRTVVATLLEYGPPNPVLAMLKPQLDELAKKPCQSNIQQVVIPSFSSLYIRRRLRKYYRYTGSLTTPPCDENVIWNIFTKVKTISKGQAGALKAPLCEANKMKNARPTQPLNGRRVEEYNGN